MPTLASIDSGKEYEELTDEQKEGIHSFYHHLETFKDHQQQIVTRESSIQLVYQLCVMIHRFQYFPAREMVYKSGWRGIAVTPTDWVLSIFVLLCTIWYNFFEHLSNF